MVEIVAVGPFYESSAKNGEISQVGFFGCTLV